ncbi:hypothetical protein LEMLEM_LOCUS13528 [Lemmus lemmus]
MLAGASRPRASVQVTVPAVPQCARLRPFPGPPLSAYPIRLCSTPPPPAASNPLCYTPSPSLSLGDANLAGRAHFLRLKSLFFGDPSQSRSFSRLRNSPLFLLSSLSRASPFEPLIFPKVALL